MGIVVGLDGTGDDSKDADVAARPYGELLRNLGNPIASLDELRDADAFAIVLVRVDVPATGVREGDRLDVTVSTLYNATSLAGGELVVSPLRPPVPGAATMALASGSIVIEGNHPRRGRIRGGAQMMTDIRTNPVSAGGLMTLVLDDQYAGYPVATMLADTINDELAIDGSATYAIVEDAKNIRVKVPESARSNLGRFISQVMRINIDPSLIQTPARIVINEDKGTIVVTADVQVGPVLIAHNGLSITSVTPEPVPTEDDPLIDTTRWAEVNTTGRGGALLADLLRAFDQLNVSVQDQIAIIHELKRSGKLHAEIVSP
jgi:flagellar P-ring protein precursor FlgI